MTRDISSALVKAEAKDLDEKIERLRQFSKGEVFGSLPTEERLRLARQLSHMNAYSHVLHERIEAFHLAEQALAQSLGGKTQEGNEPP
jgi:hypothetical protein